MRKCSVTVGLVSLLALAATNADELNPARRHPAPAADAPSAERIIVKFRSGGADGRVQALAAGDRVASLAARSGVALRQARALTSTLSVVNMDPVVPGESLAARLQRVRADAAVEYAEPDRRRHLHALPNDALYTGQWYLQNRADTPSAIDAERAWDTTTGSTAVVIAVLDTGVLFNHPDLKRAAAGGRLLPGYDFITAVQQANDGDARDPDPSDAGDFVTAAEASSAAFQGCDVTDSSWHGTRVSGIIGARANNSEGITGTTWSPWILPVRVLGKCGGFDSDILTGMLWAAGVHVDGVPDNPYPAKIENMSLGAVGTCSLAYREVVQAVRARGTLIVASAGNEGGPVDSPANCPGVAAVAGLRHAGTKVGYSSLGPQVAVSAPAGNCVNTGFGQPCLFSIDTTYNLGTTTPGMASYTDQLNSNYGTSFSAPIVTGIAGLMASVNGNLSPGEMIERLREGAVAPFPVSPDPAVPVCHVPTGPGDLQGSECSCTTSTCGAGMANARGAVTAAQRPVAVVATPAVVSPGQNVTLSGSGSAGACGRTIVGHAWSITDAFGVGITNPTPDTAVVVAPSTGSFTVRLTVTDDVGREDTADVVVTASPALTAVPAAAGTPACPQPIAAPPAVWVTVIPDAASVAAPGGTQTFVATLSDAQDTSVVWQVGGIAGGNATLGTISAAGVYTAPAAVPSPATVTVSAVSNQDPERSAAAQVTLTFAPAASDGGGGGGGGAGLDLLLMLFALRFAAHRKLRPAFAALPPSIAVGRKLRPAFAALPPSMAVGRKLLTEPRKSPSSRC